MSFGTESGTPSYVGFNHPLKMLDTIILRIVHYVLKDFNLKQLILDQDGPNDTQTSNTVQKLVADTGCLASFL